VQKKWKNYNGPNIESWNAYGTIHGDFNDMPYNLTCVIYCKNHVCRTVQLWFLTYAFLLQQTSIHANVAKLSDRFRCKLITLLVLMNMSILDFAILTGPSKLSIQLHPPFNWDFLSLDKSQPLYICMETHTTVLSEAYLITDP
jgi:hypothetical protein